MKELDAAIVSGDLCLEVSDVVLEISRPGDQWIFVLWLIVEQVDKLCFVKDTVFHNLEAHELSTFFVDMF